MWQHLKQDYDNPINPLTCEIVSSAGEPLKFWVLTNSQSTEITTGINTTIDITELNLENGQYLITWNMLDAQNNEFFAYWQFIIGIASHDGIYGQGEERMFNFETTKANLLEVFHVAPELIFIISVLIIMLIVSIIYRKISKGSNQNILFTIGMLLIIGLQVLMVSKHFKNAYLIPLFSIYGIVFFKIDDFFATFFSNKQTRFLLPALVCFFIVFTAKDAVAHVSIQKNQKGKREELRQYVVENLSKNTLWFVEPTWESAPYVENGIVYGLSYCHRINQYLPELIKVNPNVITFEGMDNTVKIWRSKPVSLDSIMMTATPIYIYSSPGRYACMLMKKINQAAHNMGIEMQTDTLFSQKETGSYIITMQNPHSLRSIEIWTLSQGNPVEREQQIQENMKAIHDDPQWLEKVKEKAIEKNIPLDSMVRLDAIWMIDNP